MKMIWVNLKFEVAKSVVKKSGLKERKRKPENKVMLVIGTSVNGNNCDKLLGLFCGINKCLRRGG
jgi:hypothetical protein